MIITIEAKPLEVKAELPGYGIFYLRKLGAAQEAEIRDRLAKAKEKIDAVAANYKDVIDKETQYIASKDASALVELKASEEYQKAKEAQAESQDELQRTINYSTRCQLELWRSDDPKAMERLFQDFSATQIQSFYLQVMQQAEAQDA